MNFWPVPVDQAEGAILAHSLRVAGRMPGKGVTLGPADMSALKAAGLADVVVARLSARDVPANAAAARLASASVPDAEAAHLTLSAPRAICGAPGHRPAGLRRLARAQRRRLGAGAGVLRPEFDR